MKGTLAFLALSVVSFGPEASPLRLLDRCAMYANCAAPPCRVAYLGDSTGQFWSATEGYDAGQQDEAIQSYFDSTWGKQRAIWDNKSLGGMRTTQVTWPSKARIVLVETGLNDMQAGDLTGFQSALTSFATIPGVVFVTMNVQTTYPAATQQTYVNAMRSIASTYGVPVADVYAYTQDKASMLTDWGHPSAALYDLIRVNVLQPAIASAVAARCR